MEKPNQQTEISTKQKDSLDFLKNLRGMNVNDELMKLLKNLLIQKVDHRSLYQLKH